jgi:outer membrane lipoprotein-sorting protein
VISAAESRTLRSRFQARQKETRTWTASFTQRLAMRGLREPVLSEGTISYRAPGDLRIDFTKPAGEFVLVLGDRLFLQKPGKRLAEKSLNDNAGKPFQSLLALLQGRPSESEELYQTGVSLESGAYAITLTRKEGASNRLPKSVVTKLAEGNMEIREVTVVLPNDGLLTYTFRNPARNRALEADFSPPAR